MTAAEQRRCQFAAGPATHAPEKNKNKTHVTCDTDVSAMSFGQWRVERAHERRREEWVSQTITRDSSAWDDTARMDTRAGGRVRSSPSCKQTVLLREGETFGGGFYKTCIHFLETRRPLPASPLSLSSPILLFSIRGDAAPVLGRTSRLQLTGLESEACRRERPNSFRQTRTHAHTRAHKQFIGE